TLRLHHRATQRRPLSSQLEIVDCLVVVVRTAVVVSELGGHLVGMFSIARFFAHSDEPMELNAVAGRQQAVEDFLIHGMVEAEPGRDGAIGPRHRPLRSEELLASREAYAARLDLVLRAFERRRNCSRRKLRSGDTGALKHRLLLWSQPLQIALY